MGSYEWPWIFHLCSEFFFSLFSVLAFFCRVNICIRLLSLSLSYFLHFCHFLLFFTIFTFDYSLSSSCLSSCLWSFCPLLSKIRHYWEPFSIPPPSPFSQFNDPYLSWLGPFFCSFYKAKKAGDRFPWQGKKKARWWFNETTRPRRQCQWPSFFFCLSPPFPSGYGSSRQPRRKGGHSPFGPLNCPPLVVIDLLVDEQRLQPEHCQRSPRGRPRKRRGERGGGGGGWNIGEEKTRFSIGFCLSIIISGRSFAPSPIALFIFSSSFYSTLTSSLFFFLASPSSSFFFGFSCPSARPTDCTTELIAIARCPFRGALVFFFFCSSCPLADRKKASFFTGAHWLSQSPISTVGSSFGGGFEMGNSPLSLFLLFPLPSALTSGITGFVLQFTGSFYEQKWFGAPFFCLDPLKVNGRYIEPLDHWIVGPLDHWIIGLLKKLDSLSPTRVPIPHWPDFSSPCPRLLDRPSPTSTEDPLTPSNGPGRFFNRSLCKEKIPVLVENGEESFKFSIRNNISHQSSKFSSRNNISHQSKTVRVFFIPLSKSFPFIWMLEKCFENEQRLPGPLAFSISIFPFSFSMLGKSDDTWCPSRWWMPEGSEGGRRGRRRGD